MFKQVRLLIATAGLLALALFANVATVFAAAGRWG